MARDRQAERAIRVVGDRILSLVINEPELVRMITEREITKRIAASELVRTEDLRAGEFEFTPKGRLKQANDAIDEALKALDAGDPERAMTILEATIPPEEVLQSDPAAHLHAMAQDDEDDPGPESEPGPEPEADDEPAGEDDRGGEEERVRRAHIDPEAEVEEEDLHPARPVELPRSDRKYDCKGCERPITGDQAQLSYISVRTELCRECLPNWDRKAGALRPKPADPAADQAEPAAAS